MAPEHDRKISEAAGEAAWSKLMTRMMEDITRSELERFEANLAKSLRTAVDQVIASLFLIASGLFGGGCLMAALILLLGQWLPWWLSFAVAGLSIIVLGELFYNRHRNPARHSTA
jgi:fatty acid desaturase